MTDRPVLPRRAADARAAGPSRADGVRIRTARPGDLPALLRLETVAFTGDYEAHRFTASDFRRYLGHPRALTAVATRDHAVLGYVCGLLSAEARAGRARLDSIAVFPAEKRRGVGRALLDWFLEASAAAGARTAILEVAKARRGTRAFLEQAGFTSTGRLPDHYGEGIDGIAMRRPIHEPVGSERD